VGGQFGALLASAPTTTTTPNPTQVLRDSLHPLSQMLVGLWPLWALLGVIALGKVALYAWKVRRLSRAGMFEIDQMSGHEFEAKLALMFRGLGYRAEVVGARGGDYGCDLVVSKDGTRTVVQAKCWKRKNVGLKAVQEVVGAMPMYAADAAMVVTNSRFTKQALTLAEKHGVQMWGRDELVVALLRGQKSKKGASVVEDLPHGGALEPPSIAPSASASETTALAERAPAVVASPSGAFCARCGTPVSIKVRDYCFGDHERFGGLVYCFKDQRAFKKPR
jgi:restriction system protein